MMTVKKKEDHYCSQEEVIKRINYLLVGNGTPEDGLAFKFAEFMSDHKVVVNDISEIKEGVKGLHDRVDKSQKAAATVANALEKYKSDTVQFEAGEKAAKEAIRVQKNLTRSRIFQIGTIVIALFMAWLGYKDLTKGQKEIQTETKTTNQILVPAAIERGLNLDSLGLNK